KISPPESQTCNRLPAPTTTRSWAVFCMGAHYHSTAEYPVTEVPWLNSKAREVFSIRNPRRKKRLIVGTKASSSTLNGNLPKLGDGNCPISIATHSTASVGSGFSWAHRRPAQ